ncbi:MAG: alpha-glucan family phosphorylase, partial [Desulfotignum sp.]
HTPVAAGHDEFEKHQVRPYISPYAEKFGISVDEILSWGEIPGEGKNGKFSMFCLGVEFSGYINGVSRLHGQVARQMWQGLWPRHQTEEIPISHVTNGVHINSYISRHKNALLERYLAADWIERQSEPALVSRIDNIDDVDLWHVHEQDRSNLIRKCRQLITHAEHPVQLVFAGKAHPNDNEGKDLIRRIVEFARQPALRHRIVFLENYDINIARYMVQGCDVWLNTPRRPYEACGTSGMKAAANGGLNLSILDGWWCEGYDDTRGWRIGNGTDYDDPEYQDEVESQALFNVLENDAIPVFYDCKRGNPPKRWIQMMKAAMKMAITDFSSDRMVREYTARFYISAAGNLRDLTEDSARKAKEMALTQSRLNALWSHIRLSEPRIRPAEDFAVGDTFSVVIDVFLGELSPDEVEVQVYHGRLRGTGELENSRAETMKLQSTIAPGTHVYGCRVVCSDSGRFGYTARVIPRGDAVLRNTPGLITWVEMDD